MKKLMSVLAILLSMGALFAQPKQMDTETAFYLYLKGSKTTLSAEEELNYAKVLATSIYDAYHNDEFEWQEKFSEIKASLKEKTSSADLEGSYTMVTKVNLEDYDFEKQGFPIIIGEGTFFPLDRFPKFYYASSNSILEKRIALKLDGFEEYGFLAMAQNDAKVFLQGRKDRYGNVDRSVTLQITFTIATFDSKEYKAFAPLALSNNYLPLVGIIEKIEVYDTSDSKKIKDLGELIKSE